MNSWISKTSESETDCFNTGHSSTSISAAMGMAKARDLKRKSFSNSCNWRWGFNRWNGT